MLSWAMSDENSQERVYFCSEGDGAENVLECRRYDDD